MLIRLISYGSSAIYNIYIYTHIHKFNILCIINSDNIYIFMTCIHTIIYHIYIYIFNNYLWFKTINLKNNYGKAAEVKILARHWNVKNIRKFSKLEP